MDHFETVCRSKDKGESSNTRRSTVHKVSEEESSDEDEVYTFSLSTKASKDQPFFRIKVHGTPVTIMADSGTSIKILDEEYHRLPSRPNLEPSSVKIYGYQSKVPLRVLGKFTTALESETNKASDKLYVVEGSGGSLLSWKTSQELNLLQTVQQVGSTPSKPETKAPADLIEEYDDLFHGLGKLKDYQIRLHIDENVPPVAQPHRRVPFHVLKQLEGQLRHDEELGVIECIEGPTPWVSPIAVAPKPVSRQGMCVRGHAPSEQGDKVSRHTDYQRDNWRFERSKRFHQGRSQPGLLPARVGTRIPIHHPLRYPHGLNAPQAYPQRPTVVVGQQSTTMQKAS